MYIFAMRNTVENMVVESITSSRVTERKEQLKEATEYMLPHKCACTYTHTTHIHAYTIHKLHIYIHYTLQAIDNHFSKQTRALPPGPWLNNTSMSSLLQGFVYPTFYFSISGDGSQVLAYAR